MTPIADSYKLLSVLILFLNDYKLINAIISILLSFFPPSFIILSCFVY
jgi:hypothetical protein